MKTIYAYGFWFLVGGAAGAVTLRYSQLSTEEKEKLKQRAEKEKEIITTPASKEVIT